MTQRRAKILATLGPASNSDEMIDALIEAGVDAMRLNFSHGTHNDHAETFRRIREQSSIRRRPIAVLADLQGPKIRVSKIPAPGMALEAGERLIFVADPNTEVSHGRVGIDCPGIENEAKVGERVLMDDGALEAQITAIEGNEIHAELVNGGVLESRKGVNLPDSSLTLPSMTAKDEADLRFALELGVDLVALSFVRKVEDLAHCREIMKEVGRVVPLVAKIEKPEAVRPENLRAIVENADGIMVARGDLGVEIGPEEVPLIQKQIIKLSNERGKLVITATQMLDSMIRNPRPTRAEASDVANAILDGSDAVMLSGETAAGKYPIRAVQTMDRIIRRIEQTETYWLEPPRDMELGHTTNAIARAAVASSRSLPDCKGIICYTGSGGIARLVSDYRPKVPIFGFTPQPATFQALSLYWGVIPVRFQASSPQGDGIFIDLDHAMLELGLFERGDRVVIALGWPVKAHTSVNLLKLHKVGETLRLG
ncbi:pyruvate kinase [Pseudenhygromyxa sp. WMMC2535]|uniref:pyruvate kinase n=1 Tax=Pseudenhygromyxa sp. WMMC2535 TaxID=2712867 RepID=UPI0015516A11|nr:pyruvate kinase [Pseudenhygromyxa sp. WMMC2535]NVB40588.1 pyruvate kinase [Pseudenhygromyxa sp. WMMC2535]